MELNYQRVPQNDLVGIKYVKDDYESLPAKGLTHGLQKDAIQNGVGAAKNFRSFNEWEMTFELMEIKGKDALIFMDKGTVGLTGDILTPEKIREKSAKGELDSTQNLSRFLSVFESGGNVGPGSYGRGKLVFQACSETHTILCDSLREDDTYVTFKRTIRNNELVQTQVFEGADAEAFINEETGGKLNPLPEHGTRITILDLDPGKQFNDLTIAQVFQNSFDEGLEDSECELAFDKMIQETWWELLLKYQVKINLIWGDKSKKVELAEPLKSILTKKDKEDDWRVYEKERLNVTIGERTFRIKRLRLVVAPQGVTLPENFRQVVIQRKRMKIGKINKNIEADNKIRKRFSGIIELDQGLEELMLEPENLTHYGYKNYHNSAIKQVRNVLRKHLGLFQEELGIIKKGRDESLEREIQEALKELNEQASDLGLMTSFGTGRKSKDISIQFKEFVLPNNDSLRVEYTDTVGPITCEIKNKRTDLFSGTFKGSIVQQGNDHAQELTSTPIEIPPKDCIEVVIDGFQIDGDFRYEEGVMLKVEVSEQKIKNTRMLWLGMDEPDDPSSYPFTLSVEAPEFPRKKSKRVEVGDEIKNVGFSITNTSGNSIKANISLSVRRGQEDNKDEIIRLINERGFEVLPLAEESFTQDEILITEELFGFFSDEPLNHDARCCEIYLKITAADYYPGLGITKGDILAPRKKIPFWVGIDDPGQSIFTDIIIEDRENDPRRSWFSGNSGAGYAFHFNQGHPAYKRIKDIDDEGELKNDFYKEEMLKQAFIISLQNENFKGLFEELGTGGDSYGDVFRDVASTDEGVITYEEIVGKALHKLYS